MTRFFTYLALSSLLLVSLLLRLADAASYKEALFSEGGSISGMVTFSGKIPEPKVFPLKDFPNEDFCRQKSDGKGNRVIQTVQVGEANGLQNAVIYIQDIQCGELRFHRAGTLFIFRGGVEPFGTSGLKPRCRSEQAGNDAGREA